MRKKTGNKLHTWEAALLLAVAAALLWGACTLQRQDALEQKVIRLHVIANSDSEADQALKLRVRDRVLVLAEDILRQSGDMEEARQRLTEALPRLQQTAAEEIAAQGSRYTVSARLEETEFPTREYDGFALPSGEYLALRVVIGEGAGKNWWCVVFPPLCTTAACDFQETAVSGGLGASPAQSASSSCWTSPSRRTAATSCGSGRWSFGRACASGWESTERRGRPVGGVGEKIPYGMLNLYSSEIYDT